MGRFKISHDSSNYIYDSNLNNIFYLNKKNQKLLDETLKLTENQLSDYQSSKNAFITINDSNVCNMNCSYCYRDKAKIKRMTISEIEDVIKYSIEKFRPDANGYIFSIGLSSEVLLDIDELKEIEKILYKYENYDFVIDDFLGITPDEFLSFLPEEILHIEEKESHFTALEKLNYILHNENINEYFKIPHDVMYSGFNSLIDNSKFLSEYKLCQLNRKVFEEIYSDKLKQRQPKFCFFSFLTNGTTLTTESINFIKGLNLGNITVSIDGPEEVHNANRRFNDGKGSYHDVLEGIKALHKNNISVTASCVITPSYLNVVRIFTHFRELKIEKISFQIVRMGTFESFTEKQIDELLAYFSQLYEMIFQEIEKGDFSLVTILNKTLMFSPIVNIIKDRRFKTRCEWNEGIQIDSNGDIYPCMYLIGNRKYRLGNYKQGITYSDIYDPLENDKLEKCKDCWARYLCGSACPFNSIMQNNSEYEINSIECNFRKKLIELSLKFYVKIFESEYFEDFIMKVCDGN